MSISDRDLDALLNHETPGSVSIYLPLDAQPNHRHENGIRWKNALRAAASADEAAARLLADIEREVRPWLDRPVGRGLAVFCGGSHRVRIPVATPVKELVVVSNHFHLTPLLESVQDDLHFHLVILTHAHVRLYSGAQGQLQELELPPDAPQGVQDVRPDGLDERRIQQHSGDAHGGTPIMHGQGLGEYRQDEDRKRFLQRLDAALHPLLDAPDISLVVCGEERLLHVFREHTAHGERVALEMPCNPEHDGPRELHERVESGLREQRNAQRRQMLAGLGAAAHEGRLQDDLAEVLPSAQDGRIDTLLLTRGAACWGNYDAERRRVTLDERSSAANEDLLNLATLRTLQHGGRVVTFEPGLLPDDAPAAALLRY